MDVLDKQMQRWSTRLRDDLRIGSPESNRLATTIAKEVAALSEKCKQEIKDASEIPLSFRLEELRAFQRFVDGVRGTSEPHPVVIRAQVACLNYFCFVYLKESCFDALRRKLQRRSTTWKCCKYLTDGRVRAFRNSVAHGNWRYLIDYKGLEYWDYKGGQQDQPLVPFKVPEQELGFWQALARCTAYSSFLTLLSKRM